MRTCQILFIAPVMAALLVPGTPADKFKTTHGHRCLIPCFRRRLQPSSAEILGFFCLSGLAHTGHDRMERACHAYFVNAYSKQLAGKGRFPHSNTGSVMCSLSCMPTPVPQRCCMPVDPSKVRRQRSMLSFCKGAGSRARLSDPLVARTHNERCLITPSHRDDNDAQPPGFFLATLTPYQVMSGCQGSGMANAVGTGPKRHLVSSVVARAKTFEYGLHVVLKHRSRITGIGD